MKICIHRGAREVGGTCVEIESQSKRIVLDIGLPLDGTDPDEMPLHPVAGFLEPHASLLGVCISHPHQDYYGLAHRLPKETVFLIGKAAQAILAAAELFTRSGLRLQNVIHLEDRKSIALGPFVLTPFLIDHSAYDSYAILLEADGKRLFYSGDFRGHGRKPGTLQRLVRNPPKNVDVLLMEGTTIGRPEAARKFASEPELEPRMEALFRQTTGMPLVWCSAQNIDRIITLRKACMRTGRQLIIDAYTAHILEATGNPRLPQAGWDNIKVFLPRSQKMQIFHNKRFALTDRLRPWRIYPQQLRAAAPRSVMIFRPSMVGDLEAANCLENACVICSLWKGYLDRDQSKPLREWLARRGLSLYHCHTSGHARSDTQGCREQTPPTGARRRSYHSAPQSGPGSPSVHEARSHRARAPPVPEHARFRA